MGFETKLISLSEVQKNILQLFYNKPIQKISINKSDRTKIWDDFIKNRDVKKYKYLEKEVPAFFYELEKALSGDKNLQPAVFSECVYAQTLAHQFLLLNFTNLLDTIGK